MANVADATSEYVPSDTELDAETGGDGLTHLVGRSPALPLLELDDRHLEILAYLILRGKAGNSTFYDAVSSLRTVQIGAESTRRFHAAKYVGPTVPRSRLQRILNDNRIAARHGFQGRRDGSRIQSHSLECWSTR